MLVKSIDRGSYQLYKRYMYNVCMRQRDDKVSNLVPVNRGGSISKKQTLASTRTDEGTMGDRHKQHRQQIWMCNVLSKLLSRYLRQFLYVSSYIRIGYSTEHNPLLPRWFAQNHFFSLGRWLLLNMGVSPTGIRVLERRRLGSSYQNYRQKVPSGLVEAFKADFKSTKSETRFVVSQ